MNFSEYLNNKTVAIVGPAGSINGTNQSKYIDGHDIVMRFNSAVPLKPEMKKDIGTRTDILCNCLEPNFTSGGKIDPDLWIREKVKWVLSPYPRELWYTKGNIANFEKINKNRIKFQCTDKIFFDDIEGKVKTRPNSGVLGILYILKHNPKSVYVTGITFGRGGYHAGYKDGITPEKYDKLANSGTHQQKPQENLFREIYNKDKRIKVDKALEEILGERNV